MTSPSLAATAATPPAARDLPLAERLGGAEFASFYDEVAPRLWAYLFTHCRHRHDADDLCQEAFSRVLASRFEPQSREHLTRYLFRTATNLLRDRGRRSGREAAALVDDDGAVAPAAAGLRHDLRRALAALAPRQRQLLWLAHVEGMDHRAIGETFGVRTGSVRVMLHRARRKLAALLGEAPKQGDPA